MICFVLKACDMTVLATVCVWMLGLPLSWGRAVIKNQNGKLLTLVLHVFKHIPLACVSSDSVDFRTDTDN